MRQDYLCGASFWHPKWLQQFANTKTFLAVYGLLGTVQAMSYMYFIVTLTTIEKRFKIPSQTTGIVLSGNEISQILLSLILSYAGGQRNRPRWIAWGVVCCGLSCFILALPHFIYGAGEDALHLTKEYGEHFSRNASVVVAQGHHLCYSTQFHKNCDHQLVTIVPLVLIFLSQFVLGIGNTLYYSLGQTYIDDNTKKTNTPLLLALAMALRLVGPIIGFQLGFASLSMFIDPTKTPLVDKNDPRWLGAWWFGWIILGSILLLFSGLVGMFPKKIPKETMKKFHSEMPKALQTDYENDAYLLHGVYRSSLTLDNVAVGSTADFPKLKDFPSALVRLLKNKLLIFNIISSIFYILGASGYMTFLTKYMEVQFQKTAQNATILIGPLTMIGMVIGLVVSGFVLTKKKPSPGKVLAWNVLVGFVYIAGEFSYMFLYCGDTSSMMKDGLLNTSQICNANCSCIGVPYSPVCDKSSETTYFSPCHAGCNSWNSEEKVYSNCSCLRNTPLESLLLSTEIPDDHSTEGYKDISEMSFISEQNYTTTNKNSLITETSTTTYLEMKTIIQTSTPVSISEITEELSLNTESSTNLPLTIRKIRSTQDQYLQTAPSLIDNLTPGACLKGCTAAFYTFAFVAMTINLFGSSGRVGNLLVNYRAVSTEDKSVAQGLALMLISLFALIPGPIIFGWIVDQTCLVWTQDCKRRGYCQLYDQKSFRYYVNLNAIGLTAVGVVFDILVWYYGRNLDLYGEKEQERLKDIRRKNRTVKPLLSSK